MFDLLPAISQMLWVQVSWHGKLHNVEDQVRYVMIATPNNSMTRCTRLETRR